MLWRSPAEGFETGLELVELCHLLSLHAPVQESTHLVHLIRGQVAIGAEVEGQAAELNVDTTPSCATKCPCGRQSLVKFI